MRVEYLHFDGFEIGIGERWEKVGKVRKGKPRQVRVMGYLKMALLSKVSLGSRTGKDTGIEEYAHVYPRYPMLVIDLRRNSMYLQSLKV